MQKLGSPMTIHLGMRGPRFFQITVVLLQANCELQQWFYTCRCMMWLPIAMSGPGILCGS